MLCTRMSSSRAWTFLAVWSAPLPGTHTPKMNHSWSRTSSHGFVRSYGSIILNLFVAVRKRLRDSVQIAVACGINKFFWLVRHGASLSVNGVIRKVLPLHTSAVNVGHLLKCTMRGHACHLGRCDAHLKAAAWDSLTELVYEQGDGV